MSTKGFEPIFRTKRPPNAIGVCQKPIEVRERSCHSHRGRKALRAAAFQNLGLGLLWRKSVQLIKSGIHRLNSFALPLGEGWARTLSSTQLRPSSPSPSQREKGDTLN